MLLALGAVGVVSGGGTVPVVPAGEHCSSSGIRTVDPKQEKPLLRVGLISDTHITQKKESCRLVQAAMELFREHQADLIINLGDIAEKYTEAGYRHYRRTVSKVFAGAEKVPQEIFIYANHDYINGKGSSLQEIATNIKKSLEIPNDPACRMTINSCVFVVLPQFYDLKSYENDIASAVKENPGKPIFVLDHIPPCNTFFNTRVWGSRKVGKILEKYPSVVHLSGHVHGTAANELSIWQGKYTAVNAGSLSPWFGCFAGLERKFAVRFSFLMSIPAILGANILSIGDAIEAGIHWEEVPMYLVGVVVAAVSGYLCIRLLKMIAEKGKFGAFAYYCWAVGVLTLVLNTIT